MDLLSFSKPALGEKNSLAHVVRLCITLISLGVFPAAFATDVKAGEALYTRLCQPCHGIDGMPSPMIRRVMQVQINLNSAQIQSLSDRDFTNVIQNGTPKMRALSAIADPSIKEIIAYVRTFRGSPLSSPAAAAIKTGQSIYELACVACHGPLGVPDPLTAKIVKVDFALGSTRVQLQTDQQLLSTILTGKGTMKPIETVSPTSAQSVVTYVRTLKN